MNTDTRRTTGLLRSSTALGAAVLVLGASPSAPARRAMRTAPPRARSAPARCSTTRPPPVPTPSTSSTRPSRRRPWTARRAPTLARATARHCAPGCCGAARVWVTNSKSGFVTHQAIRGDVTAVSGSSITVKAKDGFSLTFTVAADTKVRARANGKGTDSTIGAVKVGAKAVVTGLGATNPKARIVVFAATTSQPAAHPPRARRAERGAPPQTVPPVECPRPDVGGGALDGSGRGGQVRGTDNRSTDSSACSSSDRRLESRLVAV